MRGFRKWFAQIMINKLLKNELDQLKITIAKEMNATWKLSYGDIIQFLIQKYEESRRIEEQLEAKSFIGNLFKNYRTEMSTKLEGKTRIDNIFES